MKTKKIIINGRKRIVIVNNISGVDKTLQAVLKVMGSEWEYSDDFNDDKNITGTEEVK
ncbi:hypothetical protein KYB31_10155 [Clostridium felsineum]|uniref:hypothetical protein n=1 Tax=Clostridium felsineum TaxID=36839 RepID=UPI00214D439D|nr:hypothetical protein [Clostridium felsineum]MCR3759349.1 hypothetical protein [Clostridium felsineum]